MFDPTNIVEEWKMSQSKKPNSLPPTMPGLKAARSRTDPDDPRFFLQGLQAKRPAKLSLDYYNALRMLSAMPACSDLFAELERGEDESFSEEDAARDLVGLIRHDRDDARDGTLRSSLLPSTSLMYKAKHGRGVVHLARLTMLRIEHYARFTAT